MAEYFFPNLTDDDYEFLYNAVSPATKDGLDNYKNRFSTAIKNPSQTAEETRKNRMDGIILSIQKYLQAHSGKGTADNELPEILKRIEELGSRCPDDLKAEIAKALKEQAQKEEISEEEKKKLEASAENIEKGDDDNVITVDENISEAKEDDGWKKEVREAVKKANTDLKQEFEEYKNEEHPEHLFFKDKKNDKNIIAFASKSEGYVEGEQAAFDELVKTAQNMGKETVNFGKFEKHPEYKARLYLACLKFGMKMKNAPEIEELKEYPEYRNIASFYATKARKEYNEARATADKDNGFLRLEQQAYEYGRKHKENPNDETIKTDYERIKKQLNEHPLQQKLQKAEKEFTHYAKEMMDHYIEYGSGANDTRTKEQRKERVSKHMKEYLSGDFYMQKVDETKNLAVAPKANTYRQIEFRAARLVQNANRSR